MKKLMILMAIAAMAVSAEAASTTVRLTAYPNDSTWKDRIHCGSSSTYYTGDMYLAFGTSTTIENFKADLIAAYKKGPVDFDSFITNWKSDNPSRELTVKTVAVGSNGTPGWYWNGEKSFTIYHDSDVTKMLAFAEMTGVAGAANPNDTYLGAAALSLSDSKSKDWHATGFKSMDAFTFGGPSAVPEPTSGLLMLLGVAGLALKRKRA